MNMQDDNNIDTLALNMKTYNDPVTVADATADAESYLPEIFESPMFEEFNAALPGKKILDVGCGPGLLSKYYAEHGYDVTGMDFSEAMIGAAEKNCENCKFVVVNALDVDVVEGKFDGIVAFHLIQFLDRDEIIELFGKIADKLSGGGRFMLVFTNTCHAKSGCNVIENTGLSEYWNRWGLEDISPLFERGGLKIVKFEWAKMPSGDRPFIFVAEKAK